MTKLAILRPYIPEEAISAKQAAVIARVNPATIGSWSRRFHIGRVIGRDLSISRVALQALLEDEQEILAAYLSGDRVSTKVTSLYARLGISLHDHSVAAE